MLKAILWKEWRSQATLLIAIVVFGFVLIATVAFGMPNEWARRPQSHGMIGMLAIALIALAAGQAALTGAMLFAGEIEDQTLAHLDQHAGRRRPVWLRKMAAGFAFTFGVSGILAMAIIALGITSPRLGVLCVWLSIHAFLFAAACSVGVSTTFRAIGLTLVVLSPILGWHLTTTKTVATDFSIDKFVLAAATAAISFLRFCWPDLSRRTEPSRIQSMLGRLTLLRCWAATIGIAWQRHATGLAAALALLLVGVWYAAGDGSIAGSLLVVFLFGSFCGWMVFADDVGPEERVLGDQQVRPGSIWWCRVTTWLFVCVAVCFVANHLFQIRYFDRKIPEFADDWLQFQSVRSVILDGFLSLVMLTGIHGFAIAQFFGQWTRRMPIAVLSTIVLGIGLELIWLPTLFDSLTVWPIIVIAGFLLFCTWLSKSRWVSGRPHGKAGVLRFAGMIGVVAVVLSGNIWWRMAEIPNVGDPFDLQAFIREVEAPPPPGADGAALRAATEEMTAHYKTLEKLIRDENGKFALTDKPMPEPEELDNQSRLWTPISRCLCSERLPEGAEKLDAFLDKFMTGPWVEHVRKSALSPPIGSFLGKRPGKEFANPQPYSVRGELGAVLDAGDWFIVRAMWNLRREKSAEALSDLECSLNIARQGTHFAGDFQRQDFHDMRMQALNRVDADLLRRETDAISLRALDKILEGDEAAYPSFAEWAKMDYASKVLSNSRLQSPVPRDDWFRIWLRDCPWEKERADRVIRAAFLGMIEDAEKGVFRRDSGFPYGFECVNSRVPNWKAEHWDSTISRHRTDFFEFVPSYSRRQYIHGLIVARGLRIKIACMLHQIETGKMVQSLDELVPRYFTALPKSPRESLKFQYATDQRANSNPIMLGERKKPLAAGEAIVFESANLPHALVVPNLLKK